jgi:hypothetical protein
MTQEPSFSQEELVEALRWKRQQLADIEQLWKELREHSRNLSIRLIAEEGFSYSKVAKISGHHRNTLKAWMDVWNAEQKNRPE